LLSNAEAPIAGTIHKLVCYADLFFLQGEKEKTCFTDEDKGNMHKTGKMVKQ
jgi:hypothetical protein